MAELIFVVPVYVVVTQTLFKAAIVASNKEKIRAIIVKLGQIWRTTDLSEDQIRKKNVLLNRLNFCYTAFYWMNIIGSWQYILAPILEAVFRRYILEQECELLLPFACYYPFDPAKNWCTYIAVYLFEIYSMFRIIYYYLGSEFIMITLSSHLSTEFSLLQNDLVHLKPEYDETYGERNSGMINFIERHQTLIELTKNLDAIFNKMVFVNLTSATITICFFGFSAKVAHGLLDILKNFLAVIALVLPIFNLCYYAEMLKESSAAIGASAYENLWYKGKREYKTKILFIVRRSQKPCYLTAMKLVPITLRTFTSVMSNTWSYFSLVSSLFDN